MCILLNSVFKLNGKRKLNFWGATTSKLHSYGMTFLIQKLILFAIYTYACCFYTLFFTCPLVQKYRQKRKLQVAVYLCLFIYLFFKWITARRGFFNRYQVLFPEVGCWTVLVCHLCVLCLPEGEALCGNDIRTVVNMQHLPRLTGKVRTSYLRVLPAEPDYRAPPERPPKLRSDAWTRLERPWRASPRPESRWVFMNSHTLRHV